MTHLMCGEKFERMWLQISWRIQQRNIFKSTSICQSYDRMYGGTVFFTYCVMNDDDEVQIMYSIFVRVGRLASNEVIIQLLKSKSFPVLYHGMHALCASHNSSPWILLSIVH